MYVLMRSGTAHIRIAKYRERFERKGACLIWAAVVPPKEHDISRGKEAANVNGQTNSDDNCTTTHSSIFVLSAGVWPQAHDGPLRPTWEPPSPRAANQQRNQKGGPEDGAPHVKNCEQLRTHGTQGPRRPVPPEYRARAGAGQTES